MFMTMDAVREWARNVGYYPRFINCQWLNHDCDVWVENPHYRGPKQRHPEDCDYEMYDEFFADGTPVSLFDDGNWGWKRRILE